MTFSLIGRCKRTGRLGLGITTYSLAVGGRCEGVAANVGVCKTQAFPNRTNDPLGIKLLAQGYLPAHVMEIFAGNDTEHSFRQVAIMDRDGKIAAHTGPGCRGWAGHKEAADCVAFGNGLLGPQVLDGMIAGFLTRPDDALEYRLMRAIEGGRDAGGQGPADAHRTERSAAIKVVDRRDFPMSTSASTCTRRRSKSCGACSRSSSSTRNSIAAGIPIRRRRFRRTFS